MPSEEQNQPISYPMEPPKDLFSLYMMMRADLSVGQSFYDLYFKLLTLIDIGKEMLPPGQEELREEAETMLTTESYYPESGQFEFTDDGRYRIGPENSSTGLVYVRKEDVSIALDEVKNQQATKIIPKLKSIDSRIFKALIEAGIIEIKRPSMEEMLVQDVMMSMQEKIRVREESEEEKHKEEEKSK